MSKNIKSSPTIIDDAIALLRKGWCKREWARNKFNDKVDYYSDEATQFCAAGALARATFNAYGSEESPDYIQFRTKYLKYLADNKLKLTDLNDKAESVDEVIQFLEEFKATL